ncbi:unnamed protein product [Anisakis simplex]|uniref:Novel flotillin (inferred by orthology to a zebrafish protein) n=1 Tax=Anisakis simplex TaxID=6269 RepID=A0A0M3K5Q4_ANISI|nr:unnamed protein product [Anisakis simplex]
MFHDSPMYVVGGRALVLPHIQMVQRMSLNTITLEVHSPRVYTQKGVPVSVTGIAQVKVESRKKETLATACQLFLGKSEEEIRQIALETLEGHQRAIMGLMTVENTYVIKLKEIYQDRKKFSEKVFSVAKCDLVNMGITVVSYTIKDISDDNVSLFKLNSPGYLKALGMKRTAEVKRDARIGEAMARRDRIIKAAKTNQALKEEEMEVKIIERTAQIDVAEQEITRKERELDAKVKRPAEAEKYRLERLAKAEKQRIILDAEANAKSETVRGEAEAYAITMKAKADAVQLQKKAEAYKEFKEAALVEITLDMLPKFQLAEKVGSSLYDGVEDMKMISTGGGDVGAARVTQEVSLCVGCICFVLKLK